MEIKIRSSGKYIEVKLTAENIQFESGFLSVEQAQEYLNLFDEAAADIKQEINRIRNWSKE
jgi:hypothetical protein